MHIIISRFSAIGDVAMTIPVLYGLARANPRHRFTLMTKRGMTRMFVNAPSNLEIIGLDFRGNPISDYRTLARAVDAVRAKARGKRYFVDLHDVLRSRLLGLICRTRGYKTLRFDKARRAKRDLISHKPGAALVTSNFVRYAAPFEHIPGLRPAAPFTSIFPSGKGDPDLFAAVTGPRRDGEKWVGIAPFAAHEGKIYPPESMRQVIDELAWQGGIRIFLFGGGSREKAILDQWAAPYDNVISLAGSGLSLHAELSLMSHIDIMLTMDSANMHFAALTATPSVSIWGATAPTTGFAPYSIPGAPTSNTYIQLDDLPCRPCSIFGNKPCALGGYPCLHRIPPSAVTAAIMAHLP